MFTVIAMGVGAAYLFSAVAMLLPGVITTSFARYGEVDIFFEASAVLVLRNGEEHEESLREQEGARIARELHDGLGQQLGGLLFLMDGLHRDLRAAKMRQAKTAARLCKELSTALYQTRNLAHGLYSVAPTAEGFVEALENLAERVVRHALCPVLAMRERQPLSS
jgi:signal transduction histidine kinase